MRIGIIGMGAMGKYYADILSQHYEMLAYDLPAVRERMEGTLPKNITFAESGETVSKQCDVIIYAVATHFIEKCIGLYAPHTKAGAVVSALTSVKKKEIKAFEMFLPKDVHIITQHPLFGPGIRPQGQKIAVVYHRCSPTAKQLFLNMMNHFNCALPEMESGEVHDKISADTQAVTHFGFICLGATWKEVGQYPWDNTALSGGIDNVKILLTLRILSEQAHVYSGIALDNLSAKEQIKTFAQSTQDFFCIMQEQNEAALKKRIDDIYDTIFKKLEKNKLLLNDNIMGAYSLGKPKGQRQANSHISLLAMADVWHKLGINPYEHLSYQTPPFKLRLGIVEYLFRNKNLLEESIQTALYDEKCKKEDNMFCDAVEKWADIIERGNVEDYHKEFEEIGRFFKDRLSDAKAKSTELIRRLTTFG